MEKQQWCGGEWEEGIGGVDNYQLCVHGCEDEAQGRDDLAHLPRADEHTILRARKELMCPAELQPCFAPARTPIFHGLAGRANSMAFGEQKSWLYFARMKQKQHIAREQGNC